MKMSTLTSTYEAVLWRDESNIPRISDGIHNRNGGGNIDQPPYRNADLRNHGRQWDDNTVEQECQDGSNGPPHEEKAV